jgi:tetratricopeptide (TPR) repeat protein
VGWLIGLFVGAVLWAAARRQRRLMIGLISLGAAGLLFIGMLNLPESPLAALRAAPYLGALSRVFDGESGTGQVRTLIWEGDARLVLQGAPVLRSDGTPDPLRMLRPVLGYGPDTFYLVFRQVAPAQLLAINSPDTLTVRSHNETWDTLVTLGGLGLIAYQLLFGGLFLYGLKSLGLIATRRQRNAFVAAWIGLGLVGAATALLVGRAEYLGVAIPAGNLLGVVAYIAIATLISHPTTEGDDRPDADRWLVIALLAGVAAHYIEIQFGQAIAATRVMFWVYAGLLMAQCAARRSPAFEAPERPSTSVVQYAFVIAAILSTLLYEFVTRNYGLSDPLAILWRALTFDSVRDTSSYAALALLAVTWLATTGVAALYVARPGAYAAVAAGSLGLSALFGLGLATQLAALPAVLASTAGSSDVLALHAGLTGIFGYFVISRVALLALFGASRWLEPTTRSLRWTAQAARAWAGLPVLLALCLGLSAAAVAPINADIAYQLGVDYDASPDAAIAAYARAMASQPQQDAYYPAFAHALVYQALTTRSAAASVFGDSTRFEDVLAFEPDRLVDLNRSDLLFAAQAVFLRARSLNPLYAPHSINLARFYVPNLPVDTPAKRQLAELSDQYYAEALRLDPNAARLWNERADFELRYRNDADAALDALRNSLALDTQFAPTYLIACDAYLAQGDLDAAEQAVDRALALQPDWPEAVRKQAFVYFRQGRVEDAIAAYTRYTQIAPNSPDAWEAYKNIALLREQLGDVTGAIDAARITADLAPDDAQPQLARLIDRLNAQLAKP